MNSVSKICLSLLISISLLAHHQLWANESSDEDDDSLVMEEIEVETSLLDPPVEINPTRSSTTFNREEIETRQPDNIFEVIEDIPGVSTSGGPRNNGYNLNIRGFGDNEDIIYKLDGAIKDYEKYRFGGTFIEPELLKSVEVSRGAATTASGSGALGGVVEMETKDASDFLKPGEKYGASTKYGHRFNNDEDLRSLTLFAAPFEKLHLLFNYTDRRSNDYKLTGRVSDDSGDRLPLSETNPDSLLGKVEYYLNDDMTLGFSYINFKQKGLENFDTTAVTPSIFGVVDRDTDDKTYATKFLYEPISDLIDFSITLGFTDTDVNEVTVEGLNPVGTVTNFKYDIWALDMKNISQFKFNGIANTLTLGIDGEYSDRETSRDLPTGSIDFFDQPSGIYQQYGVYFLNEFNFGNLTITPGMRWDYNHSRVTLDSLVDFLKSNNQKASDSFDIFLPSISSSFRIQNTPLTIFANYWEQYRPPKLDEYYTIGVFNRCVSGIPVDPQSITRTCGDLYQPEESENYDLGLLMQKSNLIGRDDLLAKITYFDTSVDNVLETLNS
ncbi:MAG: TonB-dependent receptor plug domain-containing protein, partial [Pseudomonadota bacterium]